MSKTKETGGWSYFNCKLVSAIATLSLLNPLTARGACTQAYLTARGPTPWCPAGCRGWEASWLMPTSVTDVCHGTPFPEPQSCCAGPHAHVISLLDADMMSLCASCCDCHPPQWSLFSAARLPRLASFPCWLQFPALVCEPARITQSGSCHRLRMCVQVF